MKALQVNEKFQYFALVPVQNNEHFHYYTMISLFHVAFCYFLTDLLTKVTFF